MGSELGVYAECYSNAAPLPCSLWRGSCLVVSGGGGNLGLVLPMDFPLIAASSPLPSTVPGPASQSHSEFLEATRTCLSLSLPRRPLCAPLAEFVFSPQLVFHLRTCSGCCSSSEDASSISFLLYKYASGPSADLHSCFSEVLRINTCMYSAMLNRITAINNPFVWDDIPRFAVKEAESTEATHHLPSQDSMADVNGFKACPPVPPLPQREGSGAL